MIAANPFGPVGNLMRKLRSVSNSNLPRLKAVWPLDPPVPVPSPTSPAERVIGKALGYPIAVKIWPPGPRPSDPDAAWHPYDGGCWVAVRFP